MSARPAGSAAGTKPLDHASENESVLTSNYLKNAGIAPARSPDWNRDMVILSFTYRFLSNFLFMAMVYFSLNFMEKYQQRAIVAIMVLAYASMRTVSALRSFYFYQRIERLELEARRLAGVVKGVDTPRKQIVNEVSQLRRQGEVKSYIDLLFLCLIVLLCLAKIITS
jgi:hypothetical protein